MEIRTEQQEDYPQIYEIVKNAFAHAEHTCGREQDIINDIRKSENYIKELSVVATENSKIVGYAIASKMWITDGENKVESLVLGPVATTREKQRKGIASALVRELIKRAKEMKFPHITVFGDTHLYSRFGFVQSIDYDVHSFFECDPKLCMIMELTKDGLKGVRGIISYPPYFQ
ncbi:hypothetical protein EIN_162470 [Entamoeba invadens IP1]|uniref:N-acetyltransferase domain-containing protein n=1 Tax=Entamoeba invadens IP1 TaxID=370355 RepID=A0A0A1TYQ7_ENTIV|nr:hypothetical protein EIN_162470 [Entamoeba invadens IP1]ELP86603.1 hypothetical protein EIN_162470 [Entamoeba invadens IP1]|eukprot:XP_004185949.1 hypothetical protein EIN_162470 [Entamoeba invadens IP1]